MSPLNEVTISFLVFLFGFLYRFCCGPHMGHALANVVQSPLLSEVVNTRCFLLVAIQCFLLFAMLKGTSLFVLFMLLGSAGRRCLFSIVVFRITTSTLHHGSARYRCHKRSARGGGSA